MTNKPNWAHLLCGGPSDAEMARIAELHAINRKKLGAKHDDVAAEMATFQVAMEHSAKCAVCREAGHEPR